MFRIYARSSAGRTFRAGRCMGLALILMLGLGCGLADYEKHMEAEQKRLEQFDRMTAEEKDLMDPLQMPRRTVPKKDEKDKPVKNSKGETVVEEVNGLSVDFFLRPPKGIRATAQKEPKAGPIPLYTFPGENGMSLSVGARTDKAKTPEAFKKAVCQSLGISVTAPASTEQKEALRGNLAFLRLQDPQHPSLFVYLYPAGDEQLVIALKVPPNQAKEAAVTAALDASLKTLETGYRASQLRSAFGQGAKAFNERRFQFRAEDERLRK